MLSNELSDAEYAQLLSQYEYKFQKGDLVQGTICGFDSEGAIVDIGAKTNAICPEREAKLNKEDNIEDILKKDEAYEFLIIREEDEDGRFTVSYKKVASAYSWKQLEEVKEADKVIEGTVVQSVKGGVLVEVMGVRGFVPSSHLRAKEVENIIGQKIELKILSIDVSQNNFILSNRKVYADSIEDIKKDVFGQLEVGAVVKGEVVRIADFGAFIDINGIDGLLPISEISWQRIKHPSDVISLGETVEVKIIKIDTELKRISLSLKRMGEDPWQQIEGQFEEGQVITGTVNKVTGFGAFINIFPGVEALLPVSEMAEENINPFNKFKVGDSVEVLIKKFTPQEHRIALSIKDINKDAE